MPGNARSHTSSMSLDFLPPAIASAAHVIKNALAASLQISTSFICYQSLLMCSVVESASFVRRDRCYTGKILTESRKLHLVSHWIKWWNQYPSYTINMLVLGKRSVQQTYGVSEHPTRFSARPNPRQTHYPAIA